MIYNTINTPCGNVKVLRTPALVVGSGAAALNAALCIQSKNPGSVTVVTEGMKMGTSRNTGSDKQTYYKQSTAMGTPDCPELMARDYTAGGSMHGDIALVEAAGSMSGFFRLVSLGVPFPSDRYGEFTGYRTDHDNFARATSCGPLTSKYMTEALETACMNKGVPFLDGYRAVSVLTKNGSAAGVVCLSDENVSPDNPAGVVVILSGAVVWATGGPSALYASSVYPESQNCSLGAPLLAGAGGVNLTESQYGIASVKFRWNLSGSYQQVIPRYVSVDESGVEREFLCDIFDGATLSHAVFSKGYEWPFDPEKLGAKSRSSEVDIAVYREIQRGRRVYMDFRRNPLFIEKNGLSENTLGKAAYEYLKNSVSLASLPVGRLRLMNERAYQLYLAHGIDLGHEMLEIKVCAQHMNGGLECGIWYESPQLKNFYPVGECAGVFGVKRPGGTALNSTQVSSSRAAQRICALDSPAPDVDSEIIAQLGFAAKLASLMKKNGDDAVRIIDKRINDAKKHDECAALIRDSEKIPALMSETAREIDSFFDENSACDQRALVQLAINYDTLVTRLATLASIDAYIKDTGLSRGSYLICNGKISDTAVCDTSHSDKLVAVAVKSGMHICAECRMENARPIPHVENWFENVYNDYGKRSMYD